MFKKILIANRGEIAVRILRTCQRLGIAAVAVYSEPDTRSLHALEADEAVFLGGSTAAESYLDMEKLLRIAEEKGCEAVHPGYGFLSENSRFAEMVENAGLAFIGPPSEAIRLLGDKVSSRNIAEKAGVPIIPGGTEPLADYDAACSAAENAGYPLLLKPAAGGGGKGMRIVNAPGELKSAWEASRAEAQKAFGDDRIFIERYITRPRHIEIQVMADRFGNVVYLGERECSIQRRYQKIIEESPSLKVDASLRAKMGEEACRLARQAGYANAGTVEFVMESSGAFFFLEMNTRLQVEHPVTEMVTGLDLVEMQIRIAAGEPLPIRQADVEIKGWAIEARICAEDPEKGFFPATGLVTRYAEPRGQHVRVDSGVHAGSLISVFYDSLLAKIICRGQNREEARLGIINALNGYHIEGVVTNIDFVNRILNLSAFSEGRLSTDFIPEQFDGAEAKEPPSEEHLQRLVMAVTLVHHCRSALVRESLKPMVSAIGSRIPAKDQHEYMVKSGGEVFQVQLRGNAAERNWTISVNDREYDVTHPPFEFYRRRLKLTVNGSVHRFIIRFVGNFMSGSYCGVNRVFEIYTPREWELAVHMPSPMKRVTENVIRCPMPGQVVDVRVSPGERVYKGQEVVILESMKMESGVASPRDGIVAEVRVAANQAVESGDILVKFATEPA
ncbi:MAG: acetyl-CoA carboxylase biotin carboxylase subunit [Desulfobacterales bacterium]|nr:acetyl-CoA carboxylase biotin carboxylase subunit [Desulfobacterales bacterium]